MGYLYEKIIVLRFSGTKMSGHNKEMTVLIISVVVRRGSTVKCVLKQYDRFTFFIKQKTSVDNVSERNFRFKFELNCLKTVFNFNSCE